jgi:pyruvate/2-oxoglutarate dehydrogenase complex dihydrolipoamide acyltransferase (E2) component
MARTASTEARATLVHMAETWLRLAEEQGSGLSNVEGPPPSGRIEDQPVVQQQQQVQPKRENE